MKKSLWIGSILIFCVVIATIFFPYSFLSIHKSVSFHADLPSLQKYKIEVAAFKDGHEKNPLKGKKDLYAPFDQVEYSTDFILSKYEMDLVAANQVKMSKKDVNEMLDSVRTLRNFLVAIPFKEDLSSESKKYLEAALRGVLKTEEEIVRMKDSPYYSRFRLIKEFESLQVDFRESFRMYERFYDAYYHYEEEVVE